MMMIVLVSTGTSTSQNPKPSMRTPLTSVEAVTDIDAPKDPDDPGAGGGIDASNYFSRKLAAKLADCTAKIRSATDAWAVDSKLIVTTVDQQPGDLLMHITQAGMTGFFEVTYRVKLQQERARVTLYFYSPDGAQHEPATIHQLLKTYKIETFQDNLSKALLCEGK